MTASPAAEPLLAVDGLQVAYHRVAVALHGISLRVLPQTIVALVGNNGAGKTTTLRAISGFIGLDDARVTAGHILFAGERIENQPPHANTARGIVLVPERDKVFPNLTVAENLTVAVAKRASAAERRHLEALVFQFFPALAPLRSRVAGLLSGGERQMLAFGSALVCKPELLLIDELSLGLAPVVVEDLARRIAGIDGARHHRSAGRAERRRGARDCRLRLCARKRARGPGGAYCRAARPARDPAILPGAGQRRGAPQLSRVAAPPGAPAWLSSRSSICRCDSAV